MDYKKNYRQLKYLRLNSVDCSATSSASLFAYLCQRKMKKLFVLTTIIFFATALKAQVYTGGCIDSMLIQAGPPCSWTYDPVCGCDSNTYRNDCYAYYSGVTNRVSGICEPVGFDFYPNPVSDELYLTLITKHKTDVNFYIYDLWGNLYFYNYYREVDWLPVTLNVSGY